MIISKKTVLEINCNPNFVKHLAVASEHLQHHLARKTEETYVRKLEKRS